MADHGERLAVLEAKMIAVERSQVEIMEKLNAIQSQLTRYHGFLGGVAFLISGIGLFWSLLGDWIKAHWQ